MALDLDDAIDESGEIKQEALDALEPYRAHKAYMERTPSRRGLRLFLKRDGSWQGLPQHSEKQQLGSGASVEVFLGGFCTVTGDRIGENTAIPPDDPRKVWHRHVKGRHNETSGTGGRSNELIRYVGKLANKGLTSYEIKHLVRAKNAEFTPPLTEAELRNTLFKSIERYTLPDASDEHPPLVVCSAPEFLSRKFREKEVFLNLAATGEPAITGPFLAQLHAFRGVGKSNFAFGFCAAIARGDGFLVFEAPAPKRVLYVEGEMDGADLQQRVRNLVGDCSNFNIVSLEQQDTMSIPSIAHAGGRRLIEEAVEASGAELLVLDSISTLANIPTNDEESWLELSEWFKGFRIRGRSVLYLHHDGKNRQQRGHSKHEDLLNYVMHLTWPEAYHGIEGLKCTLSFGFCPNSLLPVQRQRNPIAHRKPDGSGSGREE
jgi:hypothetical protein